MQGFRTRVAVERGQKLTILTPAMDSASFELVPPAPSSPGLGKAHGGRAPKRANPVDGLGRASADRLSVSGHGPRSGFRGAGKWGFGRGVVGT